MSAKGFQLLQHERVFLDAFKILRSLLGNDGRASGVVKFKMEHGLVTELSVFRHPDPPEPIGI